MSPRFGGALNISLIITPDIANGEIGFTSNQTVVALEPEASNTSLVYKTLMDNIYFFFFYNFSKFCFNAEIKSQIFDVVSDFLTLLYTSMEKIWKKVFSLILDNSSAEARWD